MNHLPKQYHTDAPIGEQVRFNHEECGDTKQRLYVRRTVRGYVHHCHNCAPSMSGFTPSDDQLTPEGIRSALRPTMEEPRVAGEVVLPFDFTTEIPKHHLFWLKKWITHEEIIINRIGYSPSMGRIIFTLYDIESELMYWQGRRIENPTKSKPKYKNVRASGKCIFYGVGDPADSEICLVEAILSAIKVGRSIYTLGMLGSYIPEDLVRQLGNYKTVYLWFDPDKQKEMVKYAISLNSRLGVRVVPLITEKKPRDYTDEEIKVLLCECK